MRARAAGPAECAGSAFLLWSWLSALRYLRSDAHAIAWSNAGLSAVEIRLLTLLCHTEEHQSVNYFRENFPEEVERVPLEQILDALCVGGWAEASDGVWGSTEVGRRVRQQIESVTNVSSSPPFMALGAEEREQLFEILSLLPDENEENGLGF